MLIRLSIITAIFVACFVPVQAQDLDSLFNGTWVGELTQDPGGIDEKYPFKMIIKVIEGNKITGRSFANIYDDPNYANFDFSGTIFKGKLLTFQETKLYEATEMDNYTWCIKGGQLLLSIRKDMLLLEGYWQGVTKDGSGCIPGKIYLKKLLSP